MYGWPVGELMTSSKLPRTMQKVMRIIQPMAPLQTVVKIIYVRQYWENT